MKNGKAKLLPQLEGSIPQEAFGYTVSLYSVALEGWRRGLSLKFINDNQTRSLVRYSLSDGDTEHRFQVARGDAVPKKAIKVCVNKNLTKDYLKKAYVPVPEGDNFGEDASDEEIINYANELGYPLVLKPSDGTGGHGVIANIKSEEEFKEALKYVKNDLNYKKLMVEKYFAGEDFRLYVIDNKVVAAFKKDPANVLGDGTHTIKELIDIKNEVRTKTPTLHNRPIKIDKETHNLLRSNGYTVESIPQEGERVFLKTKNNVSSGGDAIDTTEELTDELREIAIKASNAIPGLVQCGVDMMINREKNSGVVLEVNSRPHITAHLFPYEGKARDIPKAVIDYYFPDTKQNNGTPSYYFDFKTVWEAFSSGFCKEYTIPAIPQGNLASTRFRISGVWGSEAYKKWVRKHALKLKLHGYVKHLQNGETSVVVSGLADSIGKFREIINNDSPKRAKVTKVVEKSWEKPVKIGFELKENSKKMAAKEKKIVPKKPVQPVNNEYGYYPVRLEYPAAKKKATTKAKFSVKKKGVKQVKKTSANEKDYQALIKERDYYKKKYLDMINSSSWKVTAPVRVIGKIVKSNKGN